MVLDLQKWVKLKLGPGDTQNGARLKGRLGLPEGGGEGGARHAWVEAQR